MVGGPLAKSYQTLCNNTYLEKHNFHIKTRLKLGIKLLTKFPESHNTRVLRIEYDFFSQIKVSNNRITMKVVVNRFIIINDAQA